MNIYEELLRIVKQKKLEKLNNFILTIKKIFFIISYKRLTFLMGDNVDDD